MIFNTSGSSGGGGASGWTDVSAEFVAFNDLWTGYDIFSNGSFVVIAGTIDDNYNSYLTVPNAYRCICSSKVFATPAMSQVDTSKSDVDSYILGNTVYMNMNGGNEFSLIYPIGTLS